MMLEHGFDGLAQVGPAYRNLTESSPMPLYMITIVKASSQLLTRAERIMLRTMPRRAWS